MSRILICHTGLRPIVGIRTAENVPVFVLYYIVIPKCTARAPCGYGRGARLMLLEKLRHHAEKTEIKKKKRKKRKKKNVRKPLLERFCTHGMYNRPAHTIMQIRKYVQTLFIISLRSSSSSITSTSSLTENILNSFEVTLWSDGRRLLTTTRRTADGCGGAGWGGLLHGLQRWYRRADEWAGGRERRRRNDSEWESAGGDTWNRVRPSRSGPRSVYAQRVLNSEPLPPAPHHRRYPVHSQQRGTTTTTTPGRARGWAAAARARHTHTRARAHTNAVHLRARCTHTKLTRARPYARGGGRAGNNA